MSSKESSSDQISETILDSMKKAVQEEEILFLAFQELRDRVEKMLGGKRVGTGEMKEAIGALKNNGKIKSRRIAGRDVFYLADILKVYKEFLSKKK